MRRGRAAANVVFITMSAGFRRGGAHALTTWSLNVDLSDQLASAKIRNQCCAITTVSTICVSMSDICMTLSAEVE